MKNIYRVYFLLLVVMLLASPLATTLAANPDQVSKAPLYGLNTQDAIPGQYIVVLKEVTPFDAAMSVQSYAQQDPDTVVLYTYADVIQGFAAQLSPEMVDALRADPSVTYVEADQVVSIGATQTNPPSWGLDRIDQRNRPLDNSYTYNYTGAGVNAYIIDTGILASHSNFGGRVRSGYTAINDGQGTNDCQGHGTHVAGTVGSSSYGVAKQVTLYAVRVLGCDGSGTNAGVIAGVDWVAQNHIKPAVANMSLGGGASSAVDTAVRNAIVAGVTVVVAAGNDNQNACNYSPARQPDAITVGSTTNTDARSSFSNIGACLDIFAPGSNIVSTSRTGGTQSMSGTSMASPHAAGVAALYLQANPSASPAQVANALINNATVNVVTGAGAGSPNRLLYSIFGTTPPTSVPPTSVPPTHTATPGSGNCTAPAWRSTSVYLAGNLVSWNNREWRAKWWTQGEEPGTTGQWGVWEDRGACAGGPTATAVPTNVFTPIPPTATPTNIPGVQAWAPGVNYTAGTLVSYAGMTYKCLQGHTSMTGWEPPNVPALWQLMN